MDEAEVPEFRFVTGKFPVTPLAKLICAQAGLFVVPVLDKYLVELVSFASLDKVLDADAYRISPCAYVV